MFKGRVIIRCKFVLKTATVPEGRRTFYGQWWRSTERQYQGYWWTFGQIFSKTVDAKYFVHDPKP